MAGTAGRASWMGDLGEMVDAGSPDAVSVLGTLTLYLGGDDHRVARLRQFAR